jgi:hypothetical protein
MDAIKATVKSGRLELDAPADWPEGTEVHIEPVHSASEKIGIDDSEWSNAPAALADWESWIRSIEPLELTPEESERIAAFDTQMRAYNLDAVQREMREGTNG